MSPFILLDTLSLATTYTHPPTPDDALHDMNVGLEICRVCVTSSIAWMTDPFPDERERFSNTHDVMDTSLPLSTLMRGEDERVSVVDGLTLTDVKVSIPDEAEKREYPIDRFDGVNVMEDTVRVAPSQMNRESVNEDDELNGLVTALSPSGWMLTIP